MIVRPHLCPYTSTKETSTAAPSAEVCRRPGAAQRSVGRVRPVSRAGMVAKQRPPRRALSSAQSQPASGSSTAHWRPARARRSSIGGSTRDGTPGWRCCCSALCRRGAASGEAQSGEDLRRVRAENKADRASNGSIPLQCIDGGRVRVDASGDAANAPPLDAMLHSTEVAASMSSLARAAREKAPPVREAKVLGKGRAADGSLAAASRFARPTTGSIAMARRRRRRWHSSSYPSL